MGIRKKLFAVYLGGRAKGCTIELHDVVFVVSRSLEEAYPRLKEKWFGNPDTVHIDSFIELEYIDGFHIQLSKEAPNSENEHKLYFVNFGAYTENLFGEMHQSAFFVAKSKPDVIKKAHANLCCEMIQTHCDDNIEIASTLKEEWGQFEVDDLVELDSVDGYHLKCQAYDKDFRSLPIPGYRKIILSST